MGNRGGAVRSAATRLVLAGLVLTGAAACDEDAAVTEPGQDLVELASSSPDLETLVAAVGAAGLGGPLSEPGPFTVFAPADAAFEGLDAGMLTALLESGNADVLEELLLGHVVSGEVFAGDLSDGQVVMTLSGDELEVTIDGGEVRVGGARVVAADLEASNGVAHVVDGVLTQGLNVVQRARVTPALSSLVTAVVEGGLVSTLEGAGPFTVFAPTNEAFGALDRAALGRLLAAENRALLQKVLTYHVLPGAVQSTDLVDDADVATVEGSTVRIDLDGGATVNGVAVVRTDIEVENGVIHVIDGVLLENLDIVDVAVLNGFSSLVDAVVAAGLEDALRDETASLTVFAPTNDAFAAIAPIPGAPETLAPILLYHVVGGEAYSTDLFDGQVLPTLQGDNLTVRLDGGVAIEGVRNTAGVLVADVPAGNGVIHAIDAVLLP